MADGLIAKIRPLRIEGYRRRFSAVPYREIPPESAYGLTINQPSIYYGEVMPKYRIVATGIKEFDYPKGNQNVYTSYRGTGGIPLASLWKRLLFTWAQSDINILLTSYLRPAPRRTRSGRASSSTSCSWSSVRAWACRRTSSGLHRA